MATKYAENCSTKDMKGTAAMIYLSLGDVARDKIYSVLQMEFILHVHYLWLWHSRKYATNHYF